MTPGKYNFPPHKRGDTFNGHSFEILENNVPVDFTGAVAKIQLRRTSYDSIVIEWKSDGGGISFDTNKIVMQSKSGVQMDIEPGIYVYDLQVVMGSGIINTYVEGTFEIINDVTK